tara:strand:- start:345 stop:869 length:525 start_codon:yes stop_codon:yes gene_type:complete
MVVENTLLTSPIFQEYILPFVLVFTLIFAILQRTKLLGDDTKQINAIISLVIGLMFVAFPFANNLVVQLMPFLAVSVVVLLIFMLMYGFVWHKEGDVLHKGVKISLGVIIALALATFILYTVGWWDTIYEYLFQGSESVTLWFNIFIIIVIIVAVIAVLIKPGAGGSSSSPQKG